MAQTIEAVYEEGVFRPLQPVQLTEGQKVTLSIEPMTMTWAEAEAQLCEWQKVYEGLSEQDTAEAEGIVFDRMALAAMADLWDNEEDAVYDNWRELYGVSEE